jgi:hypothetical protein
MNRDPATVLMYIIGIIILTGVLILVAEELIFITVSDDITIVVDKKLDQPTTYRQYHVTDTNGNEYILADYHGVKGSWERYEKLQEGCMFTIHTHGMRFAPLRMYPNIIKVQQAISAEHVCHNTPVNIV